MISVNDLRAGTTYEENGSLFQVISYEHIKIGRGSANIKVKVRNLRSGAIFDRSYINTAKVQDVYVEKREMQFLYKDSKTGFFMDPVTFEQTAIPLTQISDHQFLKEGETFFVSFLKGEPLTVHIPPKMTFVVAETGPSLKGNSATNVFKDATLENGLRTKVPLFITVGDLIRVDTRTGNYTEKA